MKFLMASYLPVLKKTFYTGPITFQFVKDVYKVIGYQAPFEEDEKKEVLNKMNSLPEKELCNYTSKRFSKLINLHKEKNGPFLCVEQLMDMSKIEANHVEKICKSLLVDLSLQTQEKKEGKAANKPLFSKGIIPKPDLKLFSSLADPTYVGVTVTLQGIAYTKIDKENLIEWSILPGVENPASQIAFQHRKLFSMASEIVNHLPHADYYLFEDLISILPKDPYTAMKHKVNLIKLRTTLMTILMEGKEKKNVGIHTVKPNVLDILFSLKVGSERTSMQEKLDQIISQNTLGENPFTLSVSQEAWTAYNECNSQGKEYLSGSLLKALAFKYLCEEAENDFK
eukprot:GFUD01019918.1.p1 GENE.GFUD01019918.1~~GFUD01019918.1.p1  ORF type:complete len:340 (-),score=74.55 GFUD01019918.1:24-1043(-)